MTRRPIEPPVPLPSPSAALLLTAVSAVAAVTIVLIVRARLRLFHSSFWLDGLAGCVVAAGLGAASGVPIAPAVLFAVVVWALSLAACSGGLWHRRPVRSLRMDSVVALAVPTGWLGVALVVLAFDRRLNVSGAAHTLLVLAFAVGLVRAFVTLRELGTLHESRRFERGFQDATIGMALVSLDLRFVKVNDAYASLLGRRPDDLVGRPVADVSHPGDAPIADALARSGGIAEKRLVRADGSVVEVAVTATRMADGHEEPYFFTQIEDVSARRRAERHTAAAADLGRRAIRLQDLGALLRETVTVVHEAIGSYGASIMRSGDGGAVTIVAGLHEDSVGRTFDDPGGWLERSVLRADRSVLGNDVTGDPRIGEHPVLGAFGLSRLLAVPVPQLADRSYAIVVSRATEDAPFAPEDARFLEAVANIVATAFDRADAEAATRHQALHDPLTGLANRTFLRGQLEQALAATRRDRSSVALLLLDVDRFKLVNDTIGHGAGDAVLCEVAERLRALVRGGDIAARLGGDEFVIACSRVGDEREVASLAGRIVDAFEEPFVAGGREWHLAASIGVAHGGAGSSADDLLRDADLAMYRAKDRGGARYEVYDAELRARVVQRLALEAALRQAVEREELVLHYQPLVDLRTGALEGFEALLRWNHPERGLVGPAEFVSIAEDTDLILPIGHWVLRSVCAQIAAWNAERPERPPVHVRLNVSPRQITPALAAAVGTAVRQAGIEATQLGLEITERLLVEEPTASAVLEEVRDLGVSVALDDFGTGYSSLSYLKTYPVDVLKLDRSLIAELGTSPESTAIVKAAVDMATALGLRVVGEGIEEPAQARVLRELGCGIGQGFLFSRPLPLDAASRLLADAAPLAAVVSV
jgi:diguanylate cyclase (GGDEF)-like protein/PAS domain S-box-containing protein